MRSPFGLTLLPNQYPALHGLRVLGILSVIQIHLSFELGLRKLLPAGLFGFTQKIWFGMDLFFVLSGFLIGNILLSGDGATSGRRILRFYARRSFRIVPLYYVVLTALALMAPLDPMKRAQLPREFLYLTNYSDIRHVVMFWGWSLCVEEHFYLAVPFLVILLRKIPGHRARIAFLVLLWLSALGVRMLVVRFGALDPAQYFQHVYIATHTRYDTLVAGILLAYLHRNFGDQLRAQLSKRGARTGLLTASGALFLLLLFPPPFVSLLVWNLLAIGTVTGLAYVLLLLPLLHHDGRLARFFGAPVFLRFATLGYGVYLVHFPLVTTVGIASFRLFKQGFGAPTVIAFLFGVAMVFGFSLAIAYAMHLVVEKPALWLRDRTVTGGRA